MTLNIPIGRPLAATLMLVAGLGTAGLLLAAQWADLTAAIEERDAKAAFVTRSLRASRPDQASDAKAASGEGLAVVAESATLAAAQVDALVRSVVAEAGGTMVSSRAEAKHDEATGGVGERIEIQAVVEGRIEALQASLFRLESGTPLVLVEALSIRPVDAGATDVRAVTAPVLSATVTLSAYWARPKV